MGERRKLVTPGRPWKCPGGGCLVVQNILVQQQGEATSDSQVNKATCTGLQSCVRRREQSQPDPGGPNGPHPDLGLYQDKERWRGRGDAHLQECNIQGAEGPSRVGKSPYLQTGSAFSTANLGSQVSTGITHLM